MDNGKVAAGWFDYAANDLAAAEYLADGMRPVPIEIVCYLCEQSAEKYLKGFLVLNGVTPRKTHDLEELGIEAARFFKGFEDVADGLSVLTSYGVGVRYPYVLEVSEDDMKRAIANAHSVKAMVLLYIKG
jgi:HEPN domain-containing protein